MNVHKTLRYSVVSNIKKGSEEIISSISRAEFQKDSEAQSFDLTSDKEEDREHCVAAY